MIIVVAWSVNSAGSEMEQCSDHWYITLALCNYSFTVVGSAIESGHVSTGSNSFPYGKHLISVYQRFYGRKLRQLIQPKSYIISSRVS